MVSGMQQTLKFLLQQKGWCLLRSTIFNFGNKFLICRQWVIYPSRSKLMCVLYVQTNNIPLELVSICIYLFQNEFLKFMTFLEQIIITLSLLQGNASYCVHNFLIHCTLNKPINDRLQQTSWLYWHGATFCNHGAGILLHQLYGYIAKIGNQFTNFIIMQ